MSRLTFRPASDSVAWQKQLRDHYLADGAPAVPHLDLKRALVRPISRRLAEQVILKYEWLGTMANSRLHFGIFFGAYCAGVCCVAVDATAAVNASKEFHVERSELGTLVRGACVHWAPPGTNSKLVSLTCRLLAKTSKLKLLLAYADTDAGEIGTIYQACNWVHIGRGGKPVQFIAPNGRIYDMKIVYDTRSRHGLLKRVSWSEQRAAFEAAGWRTQLANPKHRYVYVLDRRDTELVALIERKRQPYPKRTGVGSVDGNAVARQAADGSSTLTPTLQAAAR